MKSPEQSGFSESFNPAFDLIRSMAMTQRERLVAEADPRSEKTFEAVRTYIFGPEQTEPL